MFMDERIYITPSENNSIRSVEGYTALLLEKAREKHEGKCNSNGYVRPGSVEILTRSAPIGENGKFTGNYTYDCKIKCDILYPLAGDIIEAMVMKKNDMGVYAVFKEAIRILLPRESHVGNLDFDSIELGTKILVKLNKTRFQVNDSYIMGVGSLVSREEAVEGEGSPEGEAVVANAESKEGAEEETAEAEAEAEAGPSAVGTGAAVAEAEAVPEGVAEAVAVAEAVPETVAEEAPVLVIPDVSVSAAQLLASLPAPAKKKSAKLTKEEKQAQLNKYTSNMP
jgi:DNA-directed RNA polymerase subunit E'/Rpb7